MADDQFDIVGTIKINDDGSVVLERVNKLLDDTASKADSGGQSFLNLGTIADFALGDLAVKALEKLGDIAGDVFQGIVGQAGEMDALQRKMNATLISTGDVSGETAKSLTDLAEANRDLAGGQAATVEGAEAVLLRFTHLNQDSFPQTLKLTLDYAAATGTTAANAAMQFGRALQEPGFGAQRLMASLGEQLLPAQKKAIESMTLMGDSAGAAKVMMDALSTALAGQAQAKAQSFDGQVQILQGHISDLAEGMGMHLLPILDKLVTVFGPILEQVMTALADNFDKLADMASVWGSAIIDNLAAGMESAAGAVVDVINGLGQIISSWMAPGSPPRFLPDLATWGQDTATTYMQAWGKADFSVFDDLSKTIEGYLKSISGPKADISSTLLGDRSALSQMISTMEQLGAVSSQTFDALWAKTGITDGAIKQYTRDMIDLAAANKAVDAAQQALTDVTQSYDAQLAPLNEKLQADQNTQQDVKDDARINELKQIIANPADEQTKKSAMAELDQLQTQEKIRNLTLQKTVAVDAATAKLNAATKERDTLQKTVDLEKQRLTVIQDNTNLVNGQEAAVNKLAAAAKGAGAALGTFGQALAGLKGVDPSKLFQPPKIDTTSVSKAATDLTNAFAPVTKAVKDMQDALGSLGQWIQTNVLAQFAQLQKSLAPDLQSAIKQLNDFWTGHLQPTIEIFWRWLTTYMIPVIGMATTLFIAFFNLGVKVLADGFVNVLLPALIKYWEFITDYIIPQLLNFWTWIATTIPKALSDLAKTFWDHVNGVLKAFHDAMSGINTAINNVVGAIHQFEAAISHLPPLPSWLQSHSPTPFEMGLRGIASALQDVNAGMGGFSGNIGGLPKAQPAMSTTTNNTYNFSQHISASAPARLGDFAMLRAATRGL